MGAMNYAKAFYQYGGYGADSEFSGVLLVMFAETQNYVLYSEGDVPSVMNDPEAVGRLLEMSENDAYKGGSAAAGAESYLKQPSVRRRFPQQRLGQHEDRPHGLRLQRLSGRRQLPGREQLQPVRRRLDDEGVQPSDAESAGAAAESGRRFPDQPGLRFVLRHDAFRQRKKVLIPKPMIPDRRSSL